MPKTKKSLLKSAAADSASVGKAIFVGGATAAIFLLIAVLVWLKRRKVNPRSLRRGNELTQKQRSYLESLVAEQNHFRSKALSFHDWLALKTTDGLVSKRLASRLIRDLKLENEALREDFEIQKKRERVGRFRDHFIVSDFRSFLFCERAAYYSVLQYPSQNLIDLGFGQQIHRDYSDSEGRDSSRPARVAAFIQAQEPAVIQVEWLPNTADYTLRHPSLAIFGRPDGLFHFRDGTSSVVELKTVARLPELPRPGDFSQVDIYSLLLPKSMKLRDEAFVLYRERGSAAHALHRKKRAITEYDLAQLVARIERGARSIEELRVSGSAKKCASCGYRSICSGRA